MAKPQKSNRVPVAILVRVSTDKQDTSRQVHELQAVAAENGWEVVEVIDERGVSGKAAEDERFGLVRAQALASKGEIRKVMVHEVSRLARRNSTAHKFIEELEHLGVSLYWHAQRIETLLQDGKRNPAASIMFSLLAEMARSERETLVDRINSGLAKARRDGKTLGRPLGSRAGCFCPLRPRADSALAPPVRGPDLAAAGFGADLRHGPPGLHRCLVAQHRVARTRRRHAVPLLDQQPVVPTRLLACPRLEPDQHVATADARTGDNKF